MSAGKKFQDPPRTASGDEFVVVEAENPLPACDSTEALETAQASARQIREATPVTAAQLQLVLDRIAPPPPEKEGPFDFISRRVKAALSNDFIKDQFVEFLTTKRAGIEKGEVHSQKAFCTAFERFIVGLKATTMPSQIDLSTEQVSVQGERGLNQVELLQVGDLEKLVRSGLGIEKKMGR